MENARRIPAFESSAVQSTREDGYWLESFQIDPRDLHPSLIGYSITKGEVSVFDNPRNSPGFNPNEAEPQWKEYQIAKFDSPTGLCTAVCRSGNLSDIFITHNYGASFREPDPKGGIVSWILNPGRGSDGQVQPSSNWVQEQIGNYPSMHRVKAGHFTQRQSLELIALPIVHGPIANDSDLNTPVPLFLFQKRQIHGRMRWIKSEIDTGLQHFTVINECVVEKRDGLNELDSVILASREGVNRLYCDNVDNKWKHESIHEGMPRESGNPYYGSSSVDVGSYGGDPSRYMITIDPYNGSIVTALVKKPIGQDKYEWHRFVLDVYGDAKQVRNLGEGPGHHVIMADFDGDGNDECLVALYGSSSAKGVYYYKPIDLDNGIFAKWEVSKESTARIAVGPFTGTGDRDFATIGSSIQLNKSSFIAATTEFPIIPSDVITSVWAGKPIFYIPQPTDITSPCIVPFMDLAGYSFSLEVYPPNHKEATEGGDAVKLIYGEFRNGETSRRPLGTTPFQQKDARLQPGFLETLEEGCALIRVKAIEPQAYPNAKSVPVTTRFASQYENLPPPDPFKFLPYGNFDENKPFHNMAGVTIRFKDFTHLCYIQFWAIAEGVSAGTHNHATDTFLEVHLCLSNGTGNGGMGWVEEGTEMPSDPNDLPVEDYKLLPLHDLSEHGPFWNMDNNRNPVYRDDGSIVYPWHKWQGGNEGKNVDVWAAFEFNPRLVQDLL